MSQERQKLEMKMSVFMMELSLEWKVLKLS